jgi:DNA processing protein
MVRERASSPTPTPGEAVGEAVALLTLLRLPGVGDRTAARLVQRFGSGSGALSAPRRDFAEVAGRRAANARLDGDLRRRVERGVEWCEQAGVAIRVRGTPGYPARLEELYDPPAVVLTRGRVELLEAPALGVVGSRRSTASGRRTAQDLAAAAAREGVVVVSGLALGIDAAAHRGALTASGGTLAVLGTGPDVPHPPSNRGLFQRIAEEGLLVTEFLPGEPALPHHFPRRNRILAALSGAVVVVEAARRSGALITAGHALDLGRPVGAVPGSLYAPTSAGANALLRDGAHPILEPGDALGLLGDGFLRSAGPSAGPPVRLEGDAGRAWRALSELGRSVDELAAHTGLTAARVLGALSQLELAGLAVREAGGRFRRAR